MGEALRGIGVRASGRRAWMADHKLLPSRDNACERGCEPDPGLPLVPTTSPECDLLGQQEQGVAPPPLEGSEAEKRASAAGTTGAAGATEAVPLVGLPSGEVEEREEQGFQSGLGIRKALRKGWGATVKLWDNGLKDLSEKVNGTKSPTPPADGSSTSSPVLPADGCAQPEGDAPAHDGEAAFPAPGAAAGEVPESDAVEHSPWSPVVRPLSKAMEDAKSMGVKLADIWDMHDILDDVRQQRDYWRRRREEKARAREAEAEAKEVAHGVIRDIIDEIEHAHHAPSRRSNLVEAADDEGMPPTHQSGLELQLDAGIPQVVQGTPRDSRRRIRFGAKPSDQGAPGASTLPLHCTVGEPDPEPSVPKMGVDESAAVDRGGVAAC